MEMNTMQSPESWQTKSRLHIIRKAECNVAVNMVNFPGNP